MRLHEAWLLHEAWFAIAECIVEDDCRYICNAANRLLEGGRITFAVHAEIMGRVAVEALAHGFTKEEWESCLPSLWPTTTRGKVARLKFIARELRRLYALNVWRQLRGKREVL